MYRSIVDNMLEGMMILDWKNKILFANNTFAYTLGFQSPSELIEMDFGEFLHPDSAPLFIKNRSATKRGEVRVHYEYKIRNRQGDVRWIETRSRGVEFEGGTAHLLTARDVTDHLLAEEALRQSEEKSRAISESSMDAIILIDQEGRISYLNSSAVEMFGHSREEAVGRKLHDLIVSKEAQKEYYSRLPAFKKNGRCRVIGKTLELTAIRKNGRIFPVEISISAFQISGEWHSVGMIRDISERKRALKKMEVLFEQIKSSKESLEEKVRERTRELSKSRERYKNLVEAQNDGIFEVDLDGRPTFVNDGIVRITGRSKKEIMKKRFVDLFAPEFRERMNEQFKRHLHDPEIRRFETQVITNDGGRAYLEVVCGPLQEDGRTVAIQGIARNITERKRAEEEMKKRLMKFSLEEGTLYLVKETSPSLSLESFKDLLVVGYPGIVVGRTPEREIKKMIKGDFSFFWVSETDKKTAHSLKPVAVEARLRELPGRCAILIERLDYLISKIGFDKALSLIQRLRELAYLDDHIIIVSIDPATLSARELRLFEKEAHDIESRFIGKMPQDLLDILRLVYSQNNQGVTPSYSGVGAELGLSQPTVRKKIRNLVQSGYVREHAKGNRKVLELTGRGWGLFSR